MSGEQETRYDAAARLEEFRSLRTQGKLRTAVTEQLSTEAASAFLERFEAGGEYLRDAITLLAEISALEEPRLSEPGRRATFPLLIEALSDSFNPRYCPLYDRAFVQMITISRALPAAKNLDLALRRFGLQSERDLLERKARIRRRPPMRPRGRQAVQKVLVLSRVTLGADVALTSVVLQKARASFPRAQRIVLGSPKLAQLFGGDASLRIHPVGYQNEGNILDRLHSWLAVLEAVARETAGLAPEDYIVIDPDSRLLQLGLLPAAHDDSRYFFLESRSFGNLGQGSLSRITFDWLQSMFGGNRAEEELLPAVNLRATDAEFGREVCRRLRPDGARPLVAVSFGAGGDQRKRVSDQFEQNLVLRLLQRGSTVLLDKGFGEEELDRANRLIASLQSSGRMIVAMNTQNADALLADGREFRCDVLTWQGEIGRFASLIAESDEYIGYDSAGQHIAAALGVPAIDIFSGSASPVFQERWTPAGPGVVHAISAAEFPGDNLLSEIIARHDATQRTLPSER